MPQYPGSTAAGASGDALETMITGIVAATRAAAERLPCLYAPEGGWAGVGALGEWAATDDRTDRASVLRVDEAGSGAIVVVHTVAGSAERTASGLRYGDRTDQPGEPVEDDELPALRRDLATAHGDDIELRVDGRPVVFRTRRGERGWYAWSENAAPGTGLVVEGAGVTPGEIRIVRATDLDTFAIGQMTLLRRRLRSE
ncbi:hypothetical protein AB0O91_39925 [Kitasatospora sp. NPDC089797]|uniref:hypothetical protein n=1 Tax=Kitasatospora sp. NPDC089797 TaxID=3155298 RepID=UPI0034166F0B